MRAIAEAGSDESSTLQADFFREEYELDYRLATMGIPHIALIDGITMGTCVNVPCPGRQPCLLSPPPWQRNASMDVTGHAHT